MNCKQCGGSMTAQQKQWNGQPRTVFECNQDNGECLNERGYPTSMWPRSNNNGGGARRGPAPQQRGGGFTKSTSSDEQIKWQTCLKAAAES